MSEVPERVLRPLEQKASEQGVLMLDDYAQLAAQLTPAQEMCLDSSDKIVLRFNPRPLWRNIPALRFWANLTSVQKQAAQQGKPLTFVQFTPAQQQLFWKAIDYGLFNERASSTALLDQVDRFFDPTAVNELVFFLSDREDQRFHATGQYGETFAVAGSREQLQQMLQTLQTTQPYTIRHVAVYSFTLLFGFYSQPAVGYEIQIERILPTLKDEPEKTAK